MQQRRRTCELLRAPPPAWTRRRAAGAQAALQQAIQRGALFLARMAKARSYLEGRDYVTGGDVRAVFRDVCAHRVLLKENAGEITAEQVLDELLKKVENPDRSVLFPGTGKP